MKARCAVQQESIQPVAPNRPAPRRQPGRIVRLVARLLAVWTAVGFLVGPGSTTVDASNRTARNTAADVAVVSGLDDAEECGVTGADPGALYLTSTDLELVEDIEVPSFGAQVVGLRFVGINAPRGAAITAATLAFAAVDADPPNTNDSLTTLVIAGQAAGNPTTFSSARSDISNRPHTNATVTWSPPPWSAGTRYVTPNLTAIVQEIVNRPDWSPGGSMVFIVSGSGSRSAASYDGNPAQAAVLHVEWVSVEPHSVYLPLVQEIKDESGSLVNGDFEAGAGRGWQEYSAQQLPVVVPGFGGLGIAPHSGSWGAWLAGTNQELSFIEQTVRIAPERPRLVFWHSILSEDDCGYDRGAVLINDSVVDQVNLCADTNTGRWVLHQVDLSAYAGQSVRLQIRGETDGSLLSHLLVDDVALVATSTDR